MTDGNVQPNWTRISYRCAVGTLVLLLVYVSVFVQIMGNQEASVTFGLGAALVLLTAAAAAQEQQVRLILPSSITVLYIFTFVVIVFGILNASNFDYFVSRILTWAQFVALATCVAILTQISKFAVLRAFFVTGLIAAGAAIIAGSQTEEGRLTLAEDANANRLAYIVACAVIACLWIRASRNNKFQALFYDIAALALLYVIILTGSRQSLIAVLAAIGVFAVTSRFARCGSAARAQPVGALLGGTVVLGMIAIFVAPARLNLVMGEATVARFTGSAAESDAVRADLYRESFELFMNNPIVGIGFDQFRWMGRMEYSHSTYMELLAGTGIIGFVVWFSSYVLIAVHSFRIFKGERAGLRQASGFSGLGMAAILLMLILGFTTAIFYQLELVLFLAAISGATLAGGAGADGRSPTMAPSRDRNGPIVGHSVAV